MEPQATGRKAGPFIKHCPCSPGSVSCGYVNLNLQEGCPYDCSYCILQAYLEDKSRPAFYTNWDDMEAELRGFLAANREVRIGSGELSDSLAYEARRPTAARIADLFGALPEAVFEFKTKSDAVRALLRIARPPANIVVSWSLNPAALARGEERLAPSLARRLRALAAVQERGYKVGIHFDPLVLFPGWQGHYRELVRTLSRLVRPDRVAWWSLGALRFPPTLRPHILRREGSRLFWGELIEGDDGKFRYFTPLRLELFRFLRDELRARLSRELPLYLCMEPATVWHEVFPELPAQEGAINRYLYRSALAAEH
ncbi:MAG: radical SAM protein [Candidatus Aminicenantes bacterium]|nr:radical SAM protein [Candidatus Aminicenantes bacterium]